MPDEMIVVLLAGPVDRVMTWYSALMADARFRVQAFANDAEDFSRKLAGGPAVVVVDAALFPGPPPLLDALTRVSGCAYVLLPAAADEATRTAVAGLPCVKGVYQGDVNIAQLTGKIFADAQARKLQAPGAADWRAQQRGGPGGVTGLRIIAVWNQAGGVGKTTVAANLAYEAARRGLKALLIGLGAPDVLPLTLGLQATPNVTHWRANPTREAFQAALQRVPGGQLDVLAGFPDVQAEAAALATAPEAPDSITALAMMAAYAGYAIIVLDTPHSGLAAAALSAANTLLLVARPTLMDAWASVQALQTLAGMTGQHRIPPEAVLCVLNRVRPNGLSVSDWHGHATGALKRAFPAVVATLPESGEVELAQSNGRLPLLDVEGYARALAPLAEALFGATSLKAPAAEEKPGRVIKLGPLAFKVKK